jgi:AP-4 complex subunit sigma-1
MINFVLMVNKHGQTRLANYFERVEGRTVEERAGQEAEIVRKCLSRKDNQCSFFAYQGAQIMYRRYASLFFIVGCDDENELAILEFIHSFVETLDRYFENVCELDIMKNLEAVHFMMDEMVMNGCIVETNKQNIMAPIMLMEKYTAKGK